MSFWNNIWNKVKTPAALQEPVEEPLDDQQSLKSAIAGFFVSGMDHVSSLASLFSIEFAETVQKLKGKIICLAIGLFLLVIGYLLACVTLGLLLTRWLAPVWAIACIAGFHLLLGLILALIGAKRKLGPVAPETIKELKTDYECLQIAIKENRNS